MKRVFLFPGQGAQYPGMGKDLWENSNAVQELFEQASDAVGLDLKHLLFQGTEDELRSTDNAQVAITLMNLSVSSALREQGIRPDGVAGFSLGEYAALAEAGVVELNDVFRLVRIRGSLMEEASRKWDRPDGPPGMTAVLGLDPSSMEEILRSLEEVYPANFNSPTQTVISGTAQGLARAEARLKDAGAKRVVRLKVSGPFHCPLLEEAQKKFEEVLKTARFHDPQIPLYSNVTGKKIFSGEEARALAGAQIVSPVRWTQVEQAVKEEGFTEVLETGPGTVLTGLWKALFTEPPCKPVGRWEEIQRFSL